MRCYAGADGWHGRRNRQESLRRAREERIGSAAAAPAAGPTTSSAPPAISSAPAPSVEACSPANGLLQLCCCWPSRAQSERFPIFRARPAATSGPPSRLLDWKPGCRIPAAALCTCRQRHPVRPWPSPFCAHAPLIRSAGPPSTAERGRAGTTSLAVSRSNSIAHKRAALCLSAICSLSASPIPFRVRIRRAHYPGSSPLASTSTPRYVLDASGCVDARRRRFSHGVYSNDGG